MKILKSLFPILLVLVLSFFSFKPLLTSGFFPIHDDTQVTRVYEMAKALNDGMFPVRWSMDLGFGFGYSIFNFYAPFAYYVGGIFNLLGADPLNATKIMMIIGIALAGVSMYAFAKELFGKWGGLLSAVFYMYAPYHALNIYVRGDVAEFYAYAFIPLIFYGLYKIFQTNKFIYVAVTALSYALLISSHNLTAFMATPFVLIFAAVLSWESKKSIKNLVISLALGIGLSAFYWLPAILEMGYTNVFSQIGGGANFKDHFVCIGQLWTSQWGYGGSTKGCIDGLSFMIGKYHIAFSLFVVLVIFLLTFLKTKYKLAKEDKVNILLIANFSVFAIFSIFLMLEISKPLWQIFKPMEFFQYPWRFLVITTFSVSVIAGGIIWILEKFIPKKFTSVVSVVIIVAVIILNLKFFVPQFINNKTSSDYTNREKIAWNISNISSEYLPSGFYKPKSLSEIASFSSVESQGVNLLEITQDTNKIELLVNSKEDKVLIIPLAYFPAWQATVNGGKSKIIENPKGSLLKIKIGENRITLNFRETPVEKAANLITIASIVALLLGIIYFRKKHE